MVNPGTSRNATRIAALSTAAAIAFTAFGATAAQADEKHKVSTGDTVSALAHRYGSTIDAIIAANKLNSRATIYSGTTLTIPTKPSTTTAAPKTGSVKTSAAVTHKVVAGDTVWDLSRKYGSPTSAIIKQNGLGKSAIIRVGQKLTIPGAVSASSNTSTKKSDTPTKQTATVSTSKKTTVGSHKVVSGDSVWNLARQYGSSVSAIVSANGLGKSAVIRVGQVLAIPGTTASATTASAAKTSSGEPKLATPKNLGEFADAPTGLVGDSFLGRTYSAPVVGAANQNKATLQSMDVPSKAEMQAMIVKTAKSMGVDPALAQAVAYQESGFNMRAVSPANAIGVMQVIPTSGEWASTIVGRKLNLLIPEDNVVAGVAILKTLLRNGTPLDKAIGGYYQGETAVRKYGLYADTKRYVASVQALMPRFK